MTVPSVGVVGLGHIGGSIARCVGAAGWDPDPDVRGAAIAAGVEVVESLDALLGCGADVLVVAAPLAVCADVVADVLDAIGDDGPTVTEVASVQAPSLAVGKGHPAFVASHPMAGTERSGFASSDPALFTSAPWLVLVDDDADLARVAAVSRLVLATGAHPVPVDPAAHDRALAVVSHMPHVLAAVLSLQADGLLPLAAGSLHGAARVAAGDPALPTAMVELNRDAVDAALDGLAAAIAAFRADADPRRWFDDARAVWERHLDRALTSVERPLTIDALRAIGAAGGHVTAVASTTFTAEVPA